MGHLRIIAHLPDFGASQAHALVDHRHVHELVVDGKQMLHADAQAHSAGTGMADARSARHAADGPDAAGHHRAHHALQATQVEQDSARSQSTLRSSA
jgi:hypothetical protein